MKQYLFTGSIALHLDRLSAPSPPAGWRAFMARPDLRTSKSSLESPDRRMWKAPQWVRMCLHMVPMGNLVVQVDDLCDKMVPPITKAATVIGRLLRQLWQSQWFDSCPDLMFQREGPSSDSLKEELNHHGNLSIARLHALSWSWGPVGQCNGAKWAWF